MVPPPPKPPVICYDLAERNRLARQRHSSMKEQLDRITIQVDSLKQAQSKILETHGVGHNAARYIQKLEDDYARLRQKYNQMLTTRQHEAIKYSQHLRQCQQLNAPQQPPTPQRQPPRINKTSTSTPIRRGNSQGSSSTVSITSSSGSSLDKTPPTTSSSSSLEEDTLEITDVRFFDKMEDMTMLEVNNLMNKMRSTLKSVKEL